MMPSRSHVLVPVEDMYQRSCVLVPAEVDSFQIHWLLVAAEAESFQRHWVEIPAADVTLHRSQVSVAIVLESSTGSGSEQAINYTLYNSGISTEN